VPRGHDHGNQKPEINMNESFKKIIVSSVLSVSVLSATALSNSAQAGIQEQIKNKVDNIKDDTNLLKTRTSNLIAKANEQTQRLNEIGSTVNVVIAETDIIKAAVGDVDEVFSTVRLMKERFGEIGFDPAELLQNEELNNAIQSYREKKAAAEERLNDPDLETFRGEFSTMLQQTREILTTAEEESEPLPMQDLVALAPAPVIAVLKFAVGPLFPKMRNTVSELHAETEEMRTLRIWGTEMYSDYQCAQSAAEHERKLELTYNASRKVIKWIRDLKLSHTKIEVRQFELGVHGYTSTKITTGDDTKQQLQEIIIKLEAKKAELDMTRAKLHADSVSCS
jgi:hypothetical protein